MAGKTVEQAAADRRKSIETFRARPTFEGTYGIKPTPERIHQANMSMFESMFLAADVLREWKGGTTGVVYTSSPTPHEVAALRENSSYLQEARLAVAHLFPDGPINGFPLPQSNSTLGRELKGEKLEEITKAFAQGDNTPIRSEFARVTRLLSDHTGIDLSPLNQLFLAYTPGELMVFTNPQGPILPRDLSTFINTQGVYTPPTTRRTTRR